MRNFLNEKKTIRMIIFIMLIFVAGILIGNYLGINFCEDVGIRMLKRIANNEIQLDKLFRYFKENGL